MGAHRVNFIRLVLASCLLGALTLLTGAASRAPAGQFAFLALSGVVGLALGDAAYFRSLEILGPRRAALLMSLWPVVTGLLMVPLLGEELGLPAAGGMAVTVAGVAWVQSERDTAREVSGSLARGILLGVLGALGQASGYVLAKVGLGAAPDGSVLASLAGLGPRAAAEGPPLSGEPVAPLFGTLVRMLAGTAWVVAATLARGGAGRVREALDDRQGMWLILGGTLMGPVFGVWLSLTALRHTNTAVASTILATSPIFVIPLVRVVHGRRASWRAWAGALVAVGGIALLTLA